MNKDIQRLLSLLDLITLANKISVRMTGVSDILVFGQIPIYKYTYGYGSILC